MFLSLIILFIIAIIIIIIRKVNKVVDIVKWNIYNNIKVSLSKKE